MSLVSFGELYCDSQRNKLKLILFQFNGFGTSKVYPVGFVVDILEGLKSVGEIFDLQSNFFHCDLRFARGAKLWFYHPILFIADGSLGGVPFI